MTPVRRRDLVVLAAGLAVAAWLLVRSWYGELPSLDWWLPAPLAVLAVAEALAARTLRDRLADQRAARAEPALSLRLGPQIQTLLSREGRPGGDHRTCCSRSEGGR